MAQTAHYQAQLMHHATGETLDVLTDWISLSYVQNVNGLGWFDLELPGYFELGLEKKFKDWRLIVWREIIGSRRYIDFAGFVRDPGRSYNHGVKRTHLAGFDYNEILNRRIIAYFANSAYAAKSGLADDVMKELVYENLGAGVTDALRDYSAYLSIQGDLGLGTTIRKRCAHDNLLKTLQSISQNSRKTTATATCFGVVPLGTGYQMEFRTKVGQWGMDHRHPDGVDGAVVFSTEFGNIVAADQADKSAEEITAIYGLGEGQRENRLITTVLDATRIASSAINRREAAYDNGNMAIAADLADAARARLEEGQPQETFTFTTADVEGCVLGVNYDLGDRVTVVDLYGQARDLHIIQKAVTIAQGGKEIVTIKMGLWP